MRDRRSFLQYFSTVGLGSTLLPGVLWAKVDEGAEITKETIRAAEEIAGVTLDDTEREQMVTGLKQQSQQIDALHKLTIPYTVAPAIVFNPVVPGSEPATGDRRPATGKVGKDAPSAVRRPPFAAVATSRPASDTELAFLSTAELSQLVRARKVSSTELTRLYLDRIRALDPKLLAVTNVTEQRALERAKAMDEEIARGTNRGPLHGIPWGVKDLLDVKGYPSTWGAAPYKGLMPAEDATVVKRLDEAGAVLVAKLTLGELAMGDVWYGGTTKNPWKLDQGSSGSSAGPASATAAGLVGFSIGSETLGSISSPSTRCGTTGLRPTFGRVPRTGAMPLSWTMDKLGPICRSVEDCALVLEAIHGQDGHDLSVHQRPFAWDPRKDLKTLRIGYVKSAFDAEHPTKKWDDDALAVIRGLGVELIPVAIPEAAYGAMRLILVAEAAAAFDELTRSGKDAELAQQGPNAWPNTFRVARFIPAADYINANRARTMAMMQWAELMKTVDVIVAPTTSTQLIATNLTGHPAVIVPHGFRETDGTPVSITFLGRLFGEADMLRVAHAYQTATGFHRKRPNL